MSLNSDHGRTNKYGRKKCGIGESRVKVFVLSSFLFLFSHIISRDNCFDNERRNLCRRGTQTVSGSLLVEVTAVVHVLVLVVADAGVSAPVSVFFFIEQKHC